MDKDRNYLYLTSHMLRHYLNTLVRHSGMLTEDEIAVWSGRIRVSQNRVYNHESDRDVIASCAMPWVIHPGLLGLSLT